MKTIGLLGGMSWESTTEYYRMLNQHVAARLGGLHSARCVLWSFEFDEIHTLQKIGDWETATQKMVEAGRALQRAGADFLIICTNTMHKMADELEAAVGLPLLHIADATGARIRRAGVHKVGLLGTQFTMTEDFCRGRLAERYDLEILIPREADRQLVHDVIFGELCCGQVLDQSRAEFRRIIDEFAAAGCGGVILGCTEIGLMIHDEDSPIQVFDTTKIHAEAAALLALDGE